VVDPLFLKGSTKADKQDVRAVIVDLGNDVIVLRTVVVIVTVMSASDLEATIPCLKHLRCPRSDARVSAEEI
jgi:hypothetical protein